MLLGDALEELSAAGAFKISTSCSLAFGPGTVPLESLLRGAQAGAGAAPLSALLEFCAELLPTVGLAVCGMILTRQPTAAAAFASSTGKPAMLLPWLQTLSQALVFCVNALKSN